MRSIPILYIVIPCYNEETVLPITKQMFLDKLLSLIEAGKISPESKIMFINDGSTDTTWQFITYISKEDEHFVGISQSRNRGHQNAVFAGLMECRKLCDISISIDCDGQDDINAMDEMIDKYMEGYEIVYGVRKDRSTDSFFKRFTAEKFYGFMRLMGVEIVTNHADYRLISSKVLNELSQFREVNLFLRGLVPLVGFPSTSVYYSRKERIAGKSHYPFFKMLSLAMDGITSLSIRPIRIITSFGLLVSFLSFIGLLWAIITYFTGETVSGWASTLCIVCFIGGIQLISLGVIGEYIGKIYLEVKNRPRYIISEKTYETDEDNCVNYKK
ncbi:MAG: glycosyltransferase family 2 protein [Lachnospira sp.]